MSSAAARVGDPISHTSALDGFLAGLAIGAGVALAGVAIVGTGGLAAVAVVGAAASGGAAIGQMFGSMSTSEAGTITSGSPNVRINGIPAARAHVDHAACSKHSHKEVIAMGSAGVRINGQPAARVDDKTACSGIISSGSGNVRIGGGTVQTDEINPEIPQWLSWTVYGIGIISTGYFLVVAPVATVGGLAGGVAGGAGGDWLGGELFGEGSYGQKIMMVGGSFIGGFAGAKGAQALSSRASTWTSARNPSSLSRREYLNQRFNRTGDLNADINIRGNKKAALDYFESQGIPKADARNYLEGLDLSKNVRVETLNRGKQLWQYQAPGAPQGKWYSKTPNVTPDELGINPMGENRAAGTVVPKELSRYVTTEKVSVLRSTSAPANDFWSVKGVTYPAKGGGTQYFTPDSNIVLH